MDVYNILKKIDIKYSEQEHEPIYTVEEADKIKYTINGIGCKNLFLKDHKKNLFLVIMLDNKRCDLKKLSKLLNVKSLSFASEELLSNTLGLSKGSVTPLGICNDKDNLVKVIIDKDIEGCDLLVHPNRNDRTISISYDDLIKYIDYFQHTFYLLEL